MQHDVSFQHLRKARIVVLYESKPVGAGAVTNLEEPARSVNGRTHMSDQFRESGPISGSKRGDNRPTVE